MAHVDYVVHGLLNVDRTSRAPSRNLLTYLLTYLLLLGFTDCGVGKVSSMHISKMCRAMVLPTVVELIDYFTVM